jgi:hypothetical protein
MTSCFSGDANGFIPSGIRIYVLGTGMIDQTPDEMFNTKISHRVLGTEDFVYSDNRALKLAKSSSNRALGCAENWGYFYVEMLQRLATSKAA